MNKIILGVVALVLIVGGVAIYQKSSNPSEPLAGTSNFEKQSFVEGLFVGKNRELEFTRNGVAKRFTQGGGCTTLTPTGATLTLTQTQMLASNCFSFTASSTQPALTLTLPAVSTMTSLIANVGDTREWVINNTFTGAATTTTIAAGSGIDLQEPDTGDDFNVVIDALGFAWLKCYRNAATTVVCLVTESSVAD